MASKKKFSKKEGKYGINYQDEVTQETEIIQPIQQENQVENENIPEINEKVEKDTEISFDTYFSLLKSRDKKVYDHHKGPMKHFAEARGRSRATVAEFDELMKHY